MARRKLAQPLRLGVESSTTHAAMLGFIPLAGAEGFGQMTPEGIQAAIRHLQYAADVGRLLFIEKLAGGRGVGVRLSLCLRNPKATSASEKLPCSPRV